MHAVSPADVINIILKQRNCAPRLQRAFRRGLKGLSYQALRPVSLVFTSNTACLRLGAHMSNQKDNNTKTRGELRRLWQLLD